MVSMLDCIKRVPSLLEVILEKREETFYEIFNKYGERLIKTDEIVLVGSGTSNTSAVTAKYLAERASGVRVTVVTPNEFIDSLTFRNKEALYIFVSQTGTSKLTMKALGIAEENGWMTGVISEASTTPASQRAGAYINMGSGTEEYPMRTIGYSTSVLTIMLLGMELGKRKGFLKEESYQDYVYQAKRAVANIETVIEKTMAWLDTDRRNMMQADCIVFTGAGALYGVALEGAVKVWETPQIISMGYELEEGMHGPNYGYTHRHCVLVLNDGGVDKDRAVSMCKFMKFEKNNGFMIGADAVDSHDLSFEVRGGEFSSLEFAAAVQVISYRLAVAQGRDLFAPHDNRVMMSYFQSHTSN